MKSEVGHKKLFIGCYNKSVILTYIGVITSVYGMLTTKNINIQMTCLIVAGICDMFDGTIARMCKRIDIEKKFGVQIDSLADIISFGVFPVVIFVNIVDINIISLAVSGLFVLSGVTRLAWFNILTEDKSTDRRYFTGLPITTSALFVPLCNAILSMLNANKMTCVIVNYVIFILILICYVLNIKIKKPTGKTYILFSLLAILAIGWFTYDYL